MAPKGKNYSKGAKINLTEWTSFRPPPLADSVVIPPPPSPPEGLTPVAAGGGGGLAALPPGEMLLPPPVPMPSALQMAATAEATAAAGDDGDAAADAGEMSSAQKHKQKQQQQPRQVLFHSTTAREEAANAPKLSRAARNAQAAARRSKPGVTSSSAVPTSERLLHVLSSFQFVVSPLALVPTVDASIVKAMCSFDEFPPWEKICAVVQHGDYDEFKCAVCLDHPIAPRMLASCSHTFCSVCWIQHCKERAAVDAKKSPAPSSSSSSFGGSASSPLGVPCPVCAQRTDAGNTKPLLFVPSAKVLQYDEPLEFTRVQRFRKAPVFFKASSAESGAPMTLLPRLALDDSDEVASCARYVAFDSDVLQTWAQRQLGSLTEERRETEGSIAALVASGGPDVESTGRSPAVVALQAQLAAIGEAEQMLLVDMQAAGNAPPMPRDLVFPAGVAAFDRNNADNVVDLYRCSGRDVLFLHPMSVRMLLDNSAAATAVAASAAGGGGAASAAAGDDDGDGDDGAVAAAMAVATTSTPNESPPRAQEIPPRIRCLVDDVEEMTQSEDLRKHKSFAHIPLGGTYRVAFADMRPQLSKHVARQFDTAIDERREKIRRSLHREARKAQKVEEYSQHCEKVRAQQQMAFLEEFGVRSESNSTSVLSAEDIASRNLTAFVDLVPGGGGSGGADNEHKRQQQHAAEMQNKFTSLDDLSTMRGDSVDMSWADSHRSSQQQQQQQQHRGGGKKKGGNKGKDVSSILCSSSGSTAAAVAAAAAAAAAAAGASMPSLGGGATAGSAPSTPPLLSSPPTVQPTTQPGGMMNRWKSGGGAAALFKESPPSPASNSAWGSSTSKPLFGAKGSLQQK